MLKEAQGGVRGTYINQDADWRAINIPENGGCGAVNSSSLFRFGIAAREEGKLGHIVECRCKSVASDSEARGITETAFK